MKFDCDACDRTLATARVVISTEATDPRGVDVQVAKRWVLCRPCADELFASIGEASPWDDHDFKTIILPDEEPIGGQLGAFSERVHT
ncbi:MAG: hypothetical protein KY469_03675 [Actinobacteria bacterium]|nr:hypothetical protein [Actinomycetota bacterium]